MTPSDHNREWAYRYTEALGRICESSAHKSGQRPATEGDEMQARAEASAAMDELERVEPQEVFTP